MTAQYTPVPVEDAVARATAANRLAGRWDQMQADEAVAAVGWQLYEPASVRELTGLAFAETGLGNADHLYELHRRRVLGALHDMHGARSVGLIGTDAVRGTEQYARPVGVIAMLSPATAPTSGIATCVLQALKTRNAVIVCPNPRARRSGLAAVAAARRGLDVVGAPPDLVQWVDPVNRDVSVRLMSMAALVVAAGGPGTVRRAYRSGTPALSAGAGNPTVIVDETADLDRAAELIVYGVGFNHGTSCSAESNVLVHESVREEFRRLLIKHGAYLCDAEESAALARLLWTSEGELNRSMIGRSHTELANAAGITLPGAESLGALGLTGPPEAGSDDVIFGPKLAPVFTLSSFTDFRAAIHVAAEQIGRGGPGTAAACTRGGRTGPRCSPSSWRCAGSWSTSPPRWATAAASTTACRSPRSSPPAAGAAAASPRTSPGGT